MTFDDSVGAYLRSQMGEPMCLDSDGDLADDSAQRLILGLVAKLRAAGYDVRDGWSIGVRLDDNTLHILGIDPEDIMHDLACAFERSVRWS